MLQESLISQVVLVGDGRKFVSALVVPDRNRLLAWCRERGLAGETPDKGVPFERLLEKDEVRRIFKEIIDRSNRPLARYEQIKKFSLLPKEFTLEGGELTPTLKIKRQVIEEKYKPVIESMYAELQEA